MVSFELGKEIEEDVFRLVTSVGVPTRKGTSDLRIPRSDALPLSHRDSTVSEVYYEVQMTCVLHTVRISNVLIGTEIFCSSWELRIFSLSHARDKMKNIFL